VSNLIADGDKACFLRKDVKEIHIYNQEGFLKSWKLDLKEGIFGPMAVSNELLYIAYYSFTHAETRVYSLDGIFQRNFKELDNLYYPVFVADHLICWLCEDYFHGYSQEGELVHEWLVPFDQDEEEKIHLILAVFQEEVYILLISETSKSELDTFSEIEGAVNVYTLDGGEKRSWSLDDTPKDQEWSFAVGNGFVFVSSFTLISVFDCYGIPIAKWTLHNFKIRTLCIGHSSLYVWDREKSRMRVFRLHSGGPIKRDTRIKKKGKKRGRKKEEDDLMNSSQCSDS